jgi:hypothetical protein
MVMIVMVMMKRKKVGGGTGGNWEMVPLKGEKGWEERAKAGGQVGSGWMLQLNIVSRCVHRRGGRNLFHF